MTTKLVSVPIQVEVSFFIHKVGPWKPSYSLDCLEDMQAWSLNEHLCHCVTTNITPIKHIQVTEERAEEMYCQRSEMRPVINEEIKRWREIFKRGAASGQ